MTLGELAEFLTLFFTLITGDYFVFDQLQSETYPVCNNLSEQTFLTLNVITKISWTAILKQWTNY